MPYVYDAVHNSIVTVDDEDFEDGVLKPGRSLRVKMTMMDAAQRSIAQNEDETEDETDGDEFIDRQEAYDFARAELSARWKGGIAIGDSLTLAGKPYTVTGRNESGVVQLTDSAELSADELKYAALLNYEHDLTTAWMKDRVLPSTTAQVGGDCQIDGRKGRYTLQGDQLVCIPSVENKYRAPPSAATSPEKQQRPVSQEEWEMSGPLSDQQAKSAAGMLGDSAQEIKDAMYREYEEELVNAWRRK